MKSQNRHIGLTGILAVCLCLILAADSMAASRSGQGDGKGSFCFDQGGDTSAASETKTQETAAAQTAVASGPSRTKINSNPTTVRDTGTGAAMEKKDGTEYYYFDGKCYVIDQDWGCHYLTGFSPEATGGISTRSGKDAVSDYTAASTNANLGKIILVRGESGTSDVVDVHRYDGIYKCEDTGGEAVEYGTWNTGNTPVVDLFFDTEELAQQVSAKGWINARIYILREVR